MLTSGVDIVTCVRNKVENGKLKFVVEEKKGKRDSRGSTALYRERKVKSSSTDYQNQQDIFQMMGDSLSLNELCVVKAYLVGFGMRGRKSTRKLLKIRCKWRLSDTRPVM